MTGPEHYREAERIAAAAMSQERAHAEGFSFWQRGDLAALAQVHATLAVAAATFAGGGCGVGVDSKVAEAWREAIS